MMIQTNRGMGLVPVPYGSGDNVAIQQARAANIDEYMTQFTALLDQAGVPYHVLEQYTPASVGNPVPFYDYIVSFPGIAVEGVLVSPFVNGGANDGVSPLQLFKSRFGGYDPAVFAERYASGKLTLPKSSAPSSAEYGANLPEDYATSLTYEVKTQGGRISKKPNPIDVSWMPSDIVIPAGFTKSSTKAVTNAPVTTASQPTPTQAAVVNAAAQTQTEQSLLDRLMAAVTTSTGPAAASTTAPVSGFDMGEVSTFASQNKWLLLGAAALGLYLLTKGK